MIGELPYTSFETIDPDRARELLASGVDNNRPITKSTVDEYVGLMKRGEWETTHQGIAIDQDGNLIDGQHRLRAIVEAGVAVTMAVTFNINFDSFYAMDVGKRRSAGDTLVVAGYSKHRTTVAAAARTVLDYRRDPSMARRRKWSNLEVLELVSDEPVICDNADWGSLQLGSRRKGWLSPIVALMHIVWEDSSSEVSNFVREVSTGTDLSPGSPIILLRDRMLMTKAKAEEDRRRMPGIELHYTRFVWVVLCWNDYFDRKPRQRLSPVRRCPVIKGASKC